MRIDERGEGDRDQRELHQRRVAADGHEPDVANPRAPEWRDALNDRGGKREHKGEMTDLDNHGLATASPSCQRPCFLRASTTSRGI